MRKTLLFITAVLSLGANAQNVDDEKISFTYTQLPTHPINTQYTTFDVVINKVYDQANNDSLMAYQMRLDRKMVSYDSAMVLWQNQKIAIDRNHLVAMSTWQKNQNAGVTATQPVKPPYPAQPNAPEELMPLLNEDFDAAQINNSVLLEGYTRGAGGAVVTIDINPISNYRIVQTIKGAAAQTKYNYTVNYNCPLGIKVESPSQGVIYNTIIRTGVQSYSLPSYDSQYDFDLYMMDNRENVWAQVQQANRNTIAAAVNAEINDKCGFPVKTRATELYTIKKYKEHDYTDIRNAYTTASYGFTLMGKSRKNTEAKDKLMEAINMWLEILKESNVGDKKSRINKKVTALLYACLAETYLWTNDFDNATHYANMAINGDVMKFKNHGKGLLPLIENQKLRYNANY